MCYRREKSKADSETSNNFSRVEMCETNVAFDFTRGRQNGFEIVSVFFAIFTTPDFCGI